MSENGKVLIRKCRCGAAHRIRYREPYVWIECKKKCGMQTGFHRGTGIDDPEAVKAAIEEWNRKVKL